MSLSESEGVEDVCWELDDGGSSVSPVSEPEAKTSERVVPAPATAPTGAPATAPTGAPADDPPEASAEALAESYDNPLLDPEVTLEEARKHFGPKIVDGSLEDILWEMLEDDSECSFQYTHKDMELAALALFWVYTERSHLDAFRDEDLPREKILDPRWFTKFRPQNFAYITDAAMRDLIPDEKYRMQIYAHAHNRWDGVVVAAPFRWCSAFGTHSNYEAIMKDVELAKWMNERCSCWEKHDARTFARHMCVKHKPLEDCPMDGLRRCPAFVEYVRKDHEMLPWLEVDESVSQGDPLKCYFSEFFGWDESVGPVYRERVSTKEVPIGWLYERRNIWNHLAW